MLYQKDEQMRLAQCEENWPAIYYEENDRQIRLEMLEKIEKSNEVQDNLLAQRKQIWEARYGTREKQSTEIDYFVRGLVSLKSIIHHSEALFGMKKCKKILEEAKTDLGLHLYQTGDEGMKQVLEEEWKNLANFYYSLCVEDRNFSTGVMGFVKLKDEEVIRKIAEEAVTLAYRIPRFMQQETEFEAFSQCMIQVFTNTFRDGAELIAEKSKNFK